MRGFMVSPGERRLLRFSLGSLHTPRGFVLRRKHQNNVKGARLKLWGEGFWSSKCHRQTGSLMCRSVFQHDQTSESSHEGLK